ncbi:MAG: TonB-dependent receptor, partial [Bacteroidales bacterium]|nr:TonB-dependent receptor [Bacteroidales bacterium]
IVVMHNLNKNINFSLTWVYGTGNAITLPVSAYSIMTETGLEQIYVYEGINTFRMRDYHKMDIGFNFNKEKKWGTRTWSISVYNLYNRKNPYYYFFEKKSNNSDEVVLKQLSMFPIMPSVSYSISF